MTSSEDTEASRVYGLLRHPLRRQLIQVIGSERSVSFTELMRRMQVPVGTLHYHLRHLEGMVDQDAERHYLLTPLGQKTYAALQTPGSIVQTRPARLLEGLLLNLSRNASSAVTATAALLLLGVGTVWATSMEPLLYLYRFTQNPAWIGVAQYLLGWTILLAYLEGASFLWTRRWGGEYGLLAATALALTPSLLLPWGLWLSSDSLPDWSIWLVVTAGLVGGLITLIESLRIFKDLTYLKAVAVSLSAVYLNFLLAYLL